MPPKRPCSITGLLRHADTRSLSIPQLRQLADELRAETIDAVSQTGGHLGAGLGVVELTVALHHVYETPRDILIWDVGHQAYPHKILTGRRDRIRTLRQRRRPLRLHQAQRRASTIRSAPPTPPTSISAALGLLRRPATRRAGTTRWSPSSATAR